MWDKIEHDGFEIWVLPVVAYGPPAPGTIYHFIGYVCRHGAQAHIAGQSHRFQEFAETFHSEDEARDAGYRAGRRLLDAMAGNG